MNCIVIDNQPQAIETIRKHIANTPFLRFLKSFDDPMEAIVFTHQNKVDLVFLDIMMDNRSGIEFANTMRDKVPFIFMADCPQYAIQAFDMDAIDFLCKPLSFARFLKAVSKAMELKTLKENNLNMYSAEGGDGVNDNIIFLKSGTKIYKINVADILFLEKEGNYFTVFLSNNKKILLRTNFFEIFRFIPQSLFVRIHKSYIINVRNIDSIEAQNVMINTYVLPIGASYREKFMGSMKLA